MGAVLTGGASRRMGRTKALFVVDGTPMAVRVATALRGAGCSPVVACGGDPDELAVLDLEIVPDLYPGDGPLGGIIAVLRVFSAAGARNVLVAACDLPFLEATDLEPMVTASEAHRDADVVVAMSTRRQPTCAIWHPAALPRLQAGFDAGGRAIHRALDDLSVVEVEVSESALNNINTMDDLDRYS